MNQKSTHIVFLTPGFAISEEDSTTIPALQVYLKSLRLIIPEAKLTLLAFQFPFNSKRYSWNDIEIIPLNGRNKRLKKLLTWNKALKILKKLNKRQHITAIHSFWIGECSMIGKRFSKKNNINHITTAMGQDVNIGNKYASRLVNSENPIVSLSKSHHNTLLKNYNLDSTVIPWHLDTSSFPEQQKNTLDILGVGSLNKVKNYELFVAVIADLTKVNPSLTVEIIGEGIKRTQLEHQIQKMQLTNNIKLQGKLPRDKVLQKMTKANILLHTSNYESFGFVFLEALYAGMRIVSQNTGIAQDIPEWTLCDDTIEAFSEACQQFLNLGKIKKKRILISSEVETINLYLKLYMSGKSFSHTIPGLN